jgi:hypothetical protein
MDVTLVRVKFALTSAATRTRARCATHSSTAHIARSIAAAVAETRACPYEPPSTSTKTKNQTSFGGPGAPCTLLSSDSLDLRVVLDCGAMPSSSSSTPPSLSLLSAPDVRALVASTPPCRGLDPCPFADAVLLTSPAAVLGLPLLYRAAVDAAAGGGNGTAAAAPSSPSPPLPLHTYATEACLEIAEHWIAELLDAASAESRRRREKAAATAEKTLFFSARDARRALACVRPVRFGERLALPGGGRVVAEALPASGARLGVCCWRLRLGATERLLYLGPCASLLRGHAAPLDLRRALEGASAVILGPGAVDAAPAHDDAEADAAARRRLLFAEGRPRPPLLEQSLRGGADPADLRHAAAVHRAARAALDAVAEAAANGAASAAAAPAVAVAVAVDPTGAAFDFLEALEHEARLSRGEQQRQREQELEHEEDEEEEEQEEEEEEEGELGRPAAAAAAPPTAAAPPVRVAYTGPAAEGSLALATSAAEFLSPGRLSRVVRRAAAPFAHCRMMRSGGQEEAEEGEGAARGEQRPQKQQQRHGPPVRLRVGEQEGNADIVLVPAARVSDHRRRLLILLGTAAAAPTPPDNGDNPRVLRVPLPGERGLNPKALLDACSQAVVVVAAASQAEADALMAAAGAGAPRVVVAYDGRNPCPLRPLPAPLYEAWLSGSLASRVVLSPLLPMMTACQCPPLSAARLPPVRVGVEAAGGGGGGAWTVEEEGKGDEAAVEAAVVSALRGAGFEVSERRLEEEDDEEEGPLAVVALSVAGGGGAEVRLAFAAASTAAAGSPSRLRSVLVLSDDASLRERLKGLCEAALR